MRKPLIPLTLVVLAILVIWPSSSRAQQWTAEQMEVWKAVEDCWVVWFQHDVQAHKACFHDDYQFWPAGQAAPFGKDRLEPYWKYVRDAQSVLAYDVDPVKITVHGDAALVHWSVFIWSRGPNGELAGADSYQEAMMMVKDGGRWRYFGGAGSEIE